MKYQVMIRLQKIFIQKFNKILKQIHQVNILEFHIVNKDENGKHIMY